MKILQVFPELAQVQSLELQLPVHIAAAQPCDEALQSLLNHKYPDNLLQTLLHKRTKYHYKACKTKRKEVRLVKISVKCIVSICLTKERPSEQFLKYGVSFILIKSN